MLLALLLMLQLGAIAALAGAQVWHTALQRERETELIFVGEQYRQAIRRYYFGAPPGTPRVLPARLEDLLTDERYPVPVHHLRRLYTDPITGTDDWGFVLAADRISGVYSQSEAVPIKQAGFDPSLAQLEGKQSYRDWVFQFLPPRTAPRRR
jgi:type II secretory pathway pseudopilin PulG